MCARRFAGSQRPSGSHVHPILRATGRILGVAEVTAAVVDIPVAGIPAVVGIPVVVDIRSIRIVAVAVAAGRWSL